MERGRDEKIRERAHQIWEREGRQDGRHDAHWQRAEQELDEEERGTQTPLDEPDHLAGEEPDAGAARRKR